MQILDDKKESERLSKTAKERKSDWVTKDELANVARLHHMQMGEKHMPDIKESVQRSIVYGGDNIKPNELKEYGSPTQIVLNKDSVTALAEVRKDFVRPCLLNFASYKYPGGGFLNGSRAQEEAICHDSILYEVLSSPELAKYYEWNNQHKNRSMYLDRAVYSPRVLFEKNGETFYADVITCAAPNIGTAIRYNMSTSEENLELMKQRMNFIAKILEENHVDCLIGGAWGCGVFGQLPEEVAELYKSTKYGKTLKEIVHPIIGNNNNFEVFKKVLEN